jgi:hypothetical protein
MFAHAPEEKDGKSGARLMEAVTTVKIKEMEFPERLKSLHVP